ncbi:hypothetical protein ONS95_007239 [Cadophora gregata]|uniref:uncharacterized protein n=1 Tax=Cadophora gregata TaxID=51156 RepID=UPI0026DB14C3|nr:uncharacterized protein ONS95_007239 [Cadophora gregata]KAK0100791.1 hypothetical protein ONS95_007239 [Cadophora gregata]
MEAAEREREREREREMIPRLFPDVCNPKGEMAVFIRRRTRPFWANIGNGMLTLIALLQNSRSSHSISEDDQSAISETLTKIAPLTS